MPTFSRISTERLGQCHHKLQTLFNEVIKLADCSILCGFRNKEEQEKAFAGGKSKLHWPNSKHNQWLSRAVDVAPWPIDWDDIERFEALAAIIKDRAALLGIRVVWGGDWTSFRDYPHWELADSEE